MRTLVVLLGSLPIAAGCIAPDDDPTDPTVPSSTGSYLGAYRVPVSPELEAAATYPVDHVDWTVAGGVATLHYDLPVGLVGGELDVTLSGPVTPGAATITLTSLDGTGTCEADGTVVTCFEDFADLGPLPISMAVVEEVAAREYAGPVEDRRAVAVSFGSDPIGIVTFDLTTPGVDDHGGDDD